MKCLWTLAAVLISVLASCGGGGLSQAVTPTEVVEGHLFRSIVTGSDQTCALTETGEAYGWGDNYGGQVGKPPYNENP